MSLAVFVDDFDDCGGAFVVCLLRLEMGFKLTVCCFLHICLSSFLRPSSFPLLVT